LAFSRTGRKPRPEARRAIPERLIPGTRQWELYYHEHKQRYEFFAHRCRDLAVLDAACGVGYGTQLLARHGARSVLGIDISAEAIASARENFHHPSAEFVQGDVEQLGGREERFHVVISFETIEHLHNPLLFLEGVRDVLNPAGLFVCSTPNKQFRRTAANPYHLSEVTYEEFVSAFERHFDVEEQYHQSHSPAYLRHLDVIQELARLQKAIRFSKLMAIENSLRRWMRREQWEMSPLSTRLERAVPGDYVIEPLDRPQESHLTYILVGRPKA
jgi:SAM-dependent methyltransferase